MSSAGLVLAAGASRRMGRPKQLLEVDGRPLLEGVVAHACASGLDDVLVVLGANADAVLSGVDLGRARTVINPNHAEGLSSSLLAGLAALGPEVDRAVVILGDQPAISAGLLNDLLDRQTAAGLPAAALSFNGLLHPPVVLARELWAGMSELRGDVGCRALIRAYPDRVAAVQVAADTHHPIDVDTPEDYERLTEVG